MSLSVRVWRDRIARRSVVGATCLWLAVAVLSCGPSDRAYRGHTAREWAAQLSAPTTRERVAAAEALYHIAPTSTEVVDALIAAMKDTSGEVQGAVAVALSTVGARAVPGLADALDDDHIGVRMTALGLLADRGADAAGATRDIARALADSNEEVRIAAAQTLAHIGPAARDAEPALLEAARHGSPSLRAAALQALVANDAEAGSLGPVLATALHDTSAALRADAAPLVSRSGIDRPEALAMISPLTSDGDARVRQAAYRSIGGLLFAPGVGVQARALLLAARTDPDTGVRHAAEGALAPRVVLDSAPEPRRR